MDFLDLIASDNYIPYNRTLAKQIGVENAIIFGALCGYQRHYKQQEFFKEQDKIMEDTCLTEYSVRKAIKELQQLNLIKVTKKGLPAKYYYQINTTSLINMLSTSGYENDTTRSKEKTSTNNKRDNNKNEYNINSLFEFWNSKNIIKHKQLNSDMIKAIDKALKNNTFDEIKIYIDRYNEVIKNNDYFFNTSWSLKEFLKQNNAMNDFKDDGSKWVSYCEWKKGKPKQSTQNYTNRDYSKTDLNVLFDKIEDIEL